MISKEINFFRRIDSNLIHKEAKIDESYLHLLQNMIPVVYQ